MAVMNTEKRRHVENYWEIDIPTVEKTSRRTYMYSQDNIEINLIKFVCEWVSGLSWL
jgi:hypothetical protein